MNPEELKSYLTEYGRKWRAARRARKEQQGKANTSNSKVSLFRVLDLQFHSASGLMSFAGSEVNKVGVEEVLLRLNDSVNTVFFNGDTFSANEVKKKIINAGISECWLQILPKTQVLIIVPKIF